MDGRRLHLAAMATSEAAVVDALVAAGANVEAKDFWGRTPLHYALEANEQPGCCSSAGARRGET